MQCMTTSQGNFACSTAFTLRYFPMLTAAPSKHRKTILLAVMYILSSPSRTMPSLRSLSSIPLIIPSWTCCSKAFKPANAFSGWPVSGETNLACTFSCSVLSCFPGDPSLITPKKRLFPNLSARHLRSKPAIREE